MLKIITKKRYSELIHKIALLKANDNLKKIDILDNLDKLSYRELCDIYKKIKESFVLVDKKLKEIEKKYAKNTTNTEL